MELDLVSSIGTVSVLVRKSASPRPQNLVENGWLFQLVCYMLGTAQSCSRVTFERNLLTGLDLTITGIYIKTVQKQEKKR